MGLSGVAPVVSETSFVFAVGAVIDLRPYQTAEAYAVRASLWALYQAALAKPLSVLGPLLLVIGIAIPRRVSRGVAATERVIAATTNPMEKRMIYAGRRGIDNTRRGADRKTHAEL